MRTLKSLRLFRTGVVRTSATCSSAKWVMARRNYSSDFSLKDHLELGHPSRRLSSPAQLGTPAAGMPVPKPTLPSHNHHRVPGGLNLLAPIEIT